MDILHINITEELDINLCVTFLTPVETLSGELDSGSVCPSVRPSMCSSIHPSRYFVSAIKVHKLLWSFQTRIFCRSKSQTISMLTFLWHFSPFKLSHCKLTLSEQLLSQEYSDPFKTCLECSTHQYLRQIQCWPFCDLSN